MVYNGWNLFVRLAQPHQHFEAITSRPLLLHGVATQTQHAGQRRLTITSTHAKQSAIQAVLTHLAEFLRILKATAEQLTDAQRLRASLTRAFAKFMGVSLPATSVAQRSTASNLNGRLPFLGSSRAAAGRRSRDHTDGRGSCTFTLR